MKNGAVTLLEKPYPPEDLLKEVKHSLNLSQRRAQRKQARDWARCQLQLLDDDEREVMQLASEGLPNKAISHRLALSARTVDRRRQSAQNKLGINSPSGFTKLLAQASDEVPGLDDEDDDDDDLPMVGALLKV